MLNDFNSISYEFYPRPLSGRFRFRPQPISQPIFRARRAFAFVLHEAAHLRPRAAFLLDALLRDPDAPALFPYGGFGQCVVAGEASEDGETFFVRRILCYLPNQAQRSFRAPLRRVDFFNGYAVYRDARR